MEAIVISGKTALTENSRRYMDKVVVYMFSASWCKPCKNVKATVFGENSCIQSEKQDIVKFLLIDIDDKNNADLVECFSIKSLPTFIINKTVYNKDKSTNEFKK